MLCVTIHSVNNIIYKSPFVLFIVLFLFNIYKSHAFTLSDKICTCSMIIFYHYKVHPCDILSTINSSYFGLGLMKLLSVVINY